MGEHAFHIAGQKRSGHGRHRPVRHRRDGGGQVHRDLPALCGEPEECAERRRQELGSVAMEPGGLALHKGRHVGRTQLAQLDVRGTTLGQKLTDEPSVVDACRRCQRPFLLQVPIELGDHVGRWRQDLSRRGGNNRELAQQIQEPRERRGLVAPGSMFMVGTPSQIRLGVPPSDPTRGDMAPIEPSTEIRHHADVFEGRCPSIVLDA
jgi:hypothetical protein